MLKLSGMACLFGVASAGCYSQPADYTDVPRDPDPTTRLLIEPGAFDEADLAGCELQIDHFGERVASVADGTLRVEPRPTGLYFEAEIIDPQHGVRMRQMSFQGFSPSFVNDDADETIVDGVATIHRVLELEHIAIAIRPCLWPQTKDTARFLWSTDEPTVVAD